MTTPSPSAFDNPNYTFIEAARLAAGQGCTRMTSCFFEPFHFSQKFHPKYADPAEFKKLMTEGGHEDWTQVWKSKYSIRYDAEVLPSHTPTTCATAGPTIRRSCAPTRISTASTRSATSSRTSIPTPTTRRKTSRHPSSVR